MVERFRKDLNGLLICEECGKTCNSIRGLTIHIRYSHNSQYKKYYDKWLKKDGDGICKICGNKTEFYNFNRGYNQCCSKKCSNKLRSENYKKTCLKKYGKTNYNNHKKTKDTLFKKYGVNNAYQLPHNRKKAIQTYIRKYGNKNILKTKYVKNILKEKYNVNDNVSQNPDIFLKQQLSSFKAKKFKDTNLYYRGSYELDFLEKFYDKIDIENGPSIPYLFEGQNKVYHSDFYIPSKNLVVEIKSTWVYKQQGYDKIHAKEKAAISNGYKYILILDKKYDNFLNN